MHLKFIKFYVSNIPLYAIRTVSGLKLMVFLLTYKNLAHWYEKRRLHSSVDPCPGKEETLFSIANDDELQNLQRKHLSHWLNCSRKWKQCALDLIPLIGFDPHNRLN